MCRGRHPIPRHEPAQLRLQELLSWPRCREVEEHDEEEDCAGNVDEGVDPVDGSHERWVLQEVLLDVPLDEHVQPLLEMDDLQRMLSGSVDGG